MLRRTAPPGLRYRPWTWEFISPELIGRIASVTKDCSFSKEVIWRREELKAIFLGKRSTLKQCDLHNGNKEP